MLAKTDYRWTKTVVILALVGVIGYLGFTVVRLRRSEPESTVSTGRIVKNSEPPATKMPVMDYGKLDTDSELTDLMQQRKAKYGIENGIDMVVKSDEAIKLGKAIVSMEDILDEARARDGLLVEKNIGGSAGRTDTTIEELGIHVVRPGDNIWNIHFQLLKEYFDRKNVALSPTADEPRAGGYSTGVGRILKFSENMVYIYNVKNRQMAADINIIQPLSKIVVYRMKEVFSLLDQIDPGKVNRIQFDGDTLWIPATR